MPQEDASVLIMMKGNMTFSKAAHKTIIIIILSYSCSVSLDDGTVFITLCVFRLNPNPNQRHRCNVQDE